MNRVFIDSDNFLEEKAGRPIEKIVDEQGWDYFRELEKKVIEELSVRDNLVIATGGGVITNEENVRHLRQNGFIIWLKAGVEILETRMDHDRGQGRNRPSLTGKDPVEEIRAVLEKRAPFYEKASDRVLDTGKMSIPEAVEMIIGMIEE